MARRSSQSQASSSATSLLGTIAPRGTIAAAAKMHRRRPGAAGGTSGAFSGGKGGGASNMLRFYTDDDVYYSLWKPIEAIILFLPLSSSSPISLPPLCPPLSAIVVLLLPSPSSFSHRYPSPCSFFHSSVATLRPSLVATCPPLPAVIVLLPSPSSFSYKYPSLCYFFHSFASALSSITSRCPTLHCRPATALSYSPTLLLTFPRLHLSSADSRSYTIAIADSSPSSLSSLNLSARIGAALSRV